ncbi:hypothetical protein N806_31240 [Rhodococcus sp. P27]|nr:hypothetical protein N806_31240 [Rhodococcus sp. P27]
MIGVAPLAHADPVGCEPVATFGIGGTGSPDSAEFGPGVRKIHYTATFFPLSANFYDRVVLEGSTKMVNAVNAYAAQCPGRIVVKGYSLGARAAGDALEVLGNGPYANRISGVLYADPKRPGGIEDALEGFDMFGLKMTGPRHGFNVPVRSECNPRDGICDFPFPHNIPATVDNIAGYLTGAHAYNVNN